MFTKEQILKMDSKEINKKELKENIQPGEIDMNMPFKDLVTGTPFRYRGYKWKKTGKYTARPCQEHSFPYYIDGYSIVTIA